MLKSGVYGYHVRLFFAVVFRPYCLLLMLRKACKSRFHCLPALFRAVQFRQLFNWPLRGRIRYARSTFDLFPVFVCRGCIQRLCRAKRVIPLSCRPQSCGFREGTLKNDYKPCTE